MIVASTQQVRDLDRRAIEEYGVPGLILMENAGRGAAERAWTMLGGQSARHVLILCGRGNNGGDGFVIGRHLHNKGVVVEFWFAARMDAADPKGDAGVNLGIARRMGLPITEMPSAEDVPAGGIPAGRYDLLIDALLGTGLSGEVRQPYRALIEAINASGRPVLAVDTPSGLDGDTGRRLGVAVRATATVTFAAAKQGFFLGEGPAHVGELFCADIGCPKELVEQLASR